LIGDAEHFWQRRYCGFNIRNESQFVEKVRYIHRNPVKRGPCERPGRLGVEQVPEITRTDAKDAWRLSATGPQESVNEPTGTFANRGTASLKPKNGLNGPRVVCGQICLPS
jgi:hypothetical protein